MRLSHRKQRDFHPLQRLEKTLGAKPLRGHIDQLVAAVAHPIQAFLLLGPGERGIDQRRVNATGHQRIHLVLHQCDQRGNHQGYPTETKCRNLETQGFAPAGGHHHQTVPAGYNLRDDLLLPVQETREPEIALERFVRPRHQRLGGGNRGGRGFAHGLHK